MKFRATLIALSTLATFAAAQTLDRVVAVVENEPILESELSAQVQFLAMNNRMDPNTPGLRDQVLQSMINERLIVAKAIEDSVTVSDEEVQQQLDASIQQRIQAVGSEARLEEVYGMPLSRIKREFRDDMRKNLLAQKLQQQRFGGQQISRHEVEEFYRTYKDSLPSVPEELELSRIVVRPGASTASKAAVRAKLQALLDSLRAGADFAALAQRYSEDPGSAGRGGDLGLVRRGQFVKEFESAVFSLNPGEISDIVETDFGYHIIRLDERRGDAVRARHILLRAPHDPAGDELTTRLLDSLRQAALSGKASFAELSKKYSDDKETNLIGGTLGTLQLDQLDQTTRAAVADLKEGQISPPTRVTFGSSYAYGIFLVRRRTPPHPMTLEQDYQKIETLALNFKRTQDYQTWIDELRKSFYWEIRTEEKGNRG